MVKFRRVFRYASVQTGKQTNRQTHRHADHNISHPYWGQSNNDGCAQQYIIIEQLYVKKLIVIATMKGVRV